MTSHPTLFDRLPQDTRDRLTSDPFGKLPQWIAGMTRHEILARQGVAPMPTNITFNPSRLSRSTDPETSHKAAESASRRGPTQRRQVWDALKKLGGATDYEISVETNILRSSAAKRRQELVELGHVVETPFRRKTDTGTEAIVWRCSYLSDYSSDSSSQS